MSFPPGPPALPSPYSQSDPFGALYPPPTTPRKFRNRTWLHVILFLATLATTTLTGACHYHSFASEFGRVQPPIDWFLLVEGLWYSGPLLAILGAHELGHYLFCRRYNVDATLPFFIPAPLPLTGTLGAVIRIREPFPTRTALFDIGVAGPIGGFLVLVPALFVGLHLSNIVPAPTEGGVYMLGEPLLFRGAVQLVFGTVPDGQTVNMHPMVFASWFGMLATALNLLPFGQLDGGHICYATVPRWARQISLATVALAMVMTLAVSSSWFFMTLMMVAMLVILGPSHPRVIYEYEPLPRSRYWIGVLALILLILCFTPAPIEFQDLIRPAETLAGHQR